jgi:hypothetical protein
MPKGSLRDRGEQKPPPDTPAKMRGKDAAVFRLQAEFALQTPSHQSGRDAGLMALDGKQKSD